MATAASHVAAIRFGLGLRLGEPPPRDPRAWLTAQLGVPEALPPIPPVAEALRVRAEDVSQRQQGRERAGPGRSNVMTRDAVLAWARHRLTTTQPYRERLVDFWMNHFTVSRRVGAAQTLVAPMEREAIRPHLTGKFADMLVAVTRHPAMLLYLDNATSVGPNSAFGQRAGRGLNENLAREILELHTLSPAGGYTQGDVTEFARILTGWSVEQRNEPFGFLFRPQAHEPGEKSLMGRRFEQGEAAGEQALRFLAAQPATHRHLAVKLVRHFVADDPPPAATRRIEAVLRDTDGDLGATARALIALEEAWAPPLAKVRSAQDFVLAICRGLAIPEDREEWVVGGLLTLSQPLWTAPQPIGWPDKAEAWASPEALMRRVDWAHTIAGRFAQSDPRLVAEATLGPLARAETVTAMSRAGSVRDSLTLLFGSPEFMRR